MVNSSLILALKPTKDCLNSIIDDRQDIFLTTAAATALLTFTVLQYAGEITDSYDA